ncbi:MAG: 4-hydroxy-tetrahydrodipicolinate synthase [Chthoniobacterales bacterium]|nr:4-hydroxy-tetrahydrodipicolinate synthase [Chthoniobacterales bacterium]
MNTYLDFSGVHTALATPFLNGKLDVESFHRLIDFQISSGINGIVPVGTTGESPTLSHEEHIEVIRLAIEFAGGRCLVIAGTGSNSTDEAIYLTHKAQELGANAVLLVAPYYNRPTQEGLYLHFREIAKATHLPVVLYSIPGRCGVEIAIPTIQRLHEDCPNIYCLKEAGGSVERMNQLRHALPSSFQLLSGDDSLTLPFLCTGAIGVISVASNLIPAEVLEMVNAWNAGDGLRAAQLHQRLYPLFRDLFIETNPVPIKFALAKKGLIASPEVRLPLAPLSQLSAEKLTATLTCLDSQT